MVHLNEVQAANERCLGDLDEMTAVFAPGTTGIGRYALCRLALIRGRQGKGFYAYLVARSQEKADAVIEQCKRDCPMAEFCFIQTSDIALLSEVDRACNEIVRREGERRGGAKASIDVMVLSPGKIEIGPRIDTTEGLDRSMSLLYYCRLRFIDNLLPLLVASPNAARVISVYAGGLEKEFYPDDLSLRSHYSFSACRTQVIHMKTLAFERLAQQNKGKISLVHYFPGVVVTPAYDSPEMPMWFRIAWTILGPLVKLFMAVSHDESGDRVLFLATDRFAPLNDAAKAKEMKCALSTDGVQGGGSYSVTWNDETAPQALMDKSYTRLRKEGVGEKVWSHTTSAFAAISTGQPFAD